MELCSQIFKNPTSSACNSSYLADEARRRQPWCSVCGGDESLEAHHVIWLERGGADALDNLTVLCTTHHALVHTSPAWDRRVRERYFADKLPPCAHLLDGAL